MLTKQEHFIKMLLVYLFNKKNNLPLFKIHTTEVVTTLRELFYNIVTIYSATLNNVY